MRKTFFFFTVLVLIFSGGSVLGQCPNDNPFNGFPNPFNPTGPGAAGAITSSNSWGGDYLETNVTSGDVYTWTGCASGTPFDAAFTLYQQPGGLLAFNDNFCGSDPEITWTATFTGTVRLMIDLMPGCLNNSVHYPVTLSYTTGCIALAVTTQPSNSNICPGDNSSFTGAFSGDTPITYQWSFSTNGGSTWVPFANGGSNPTVSGATTPNLTLNSVPGSFNGYLVRLEGTNPCGSLNTNSAQISTTDNAAPTYTNPGNQNGAVNGSCQVSLPDFWTSLSIPVTDNCDPSPVTSQSPASGTIISGANTSLTVSLIARDASFNTATSTFTFTTRDTTPPTLTCQNVTLYLDGSGQATLLPVDVFQGGSDNCGSVNLSSVSPNSFTCSQLGAQTVTLTANDGFTNDGTCTATVTVTDSTSPTITCPSNIVLGNTSGLCSRVVSYTAPSGTDNCGTPTISLTSGLGSGASFPVGLTTETYQASDGGGNTRSCSFTVQIFDTEGPAITSPGNQELPVNGSCQVSLPDFWTSLSIPVVDNCDPNPATSQVPAVGTVISGANTSLTVSLTANDAAFNTGTSTFTLTTRDTTPPSITCQNVTLFLNGSGQATLLPADVFQGGSDNCGSVNLMNVFPNSFNCSQVGAQTVTLTANDGFSNNGSCTATVTVVDSTSPSISCPSNVVLNNTPGQCNRVFTYTAPSGTDNCSSPTVSLTSGESPSTSSTVSRVT